MPPAEYWTQQWIRVTRLLLGVKPPTRRGGMRARCRRQAEVSRWLWMRNLPNQPINEANVRACPPALARALAEFGLPEAIADFAGLAQGNHAIEHLSEHA